MEVEMTRLGIALTLALAFAPIPGAAQSPPEVWDAREMGAFVDGVIEAQKEAHHFAGAVVTVVQNGEILFSKGYGYADFAERKPVNPARTLFRVASNSKMFVWTAVMQLVEQGKLDLHTDVNQYLEGVQVPPTFPEPITLEHLMTHTAGFEDKVIGLFSNDAGVMRPLAELMKRDMPGRVFPPGKATAYSNYGTALAALIVEQVSGIPYGRHLREKILDPLGMAHATIAQPVPQNLAADVSKGYRWSGGRFREQPFEFVPWAPVGGMSVSGEDMARFMIAHLNDGALGESRILQPETARRMRAKLTSFSPKINGMLHGFMELNGNGEMAYGHGGDTTWFHSRTTMIPARNLGVFVAYNTNSGATARDQFVPAFFEHYFPAPLANEPPPTKERQADLQRFAGTYATSRASQSDATSMIRLVGVMSVSVDSDGYLATSFFGQPARWRQIEPLVFAEVDGHEQLVFRENERGEIEDAGMSPVGVFILQKRPWWNALPFQLPLLGVSIAILLVALIGIPIAAALQRKQAAPAGAISARATAWLTSAAFVGGLAAFLVGMQDPNMLTFGLPTAVRAALTLWVAGAVLTLGVVVFTFLSWRRRWWGMAGRVSLTLVCLAAAGCVLWLNHWNLLGFKY
jgi:CubicO group peptidase (beta-lactamase class C family)